jgi:hypothetical protein
VTERGLLVAFGLALAVAGCAAKPPGDADRPSPGAMPAGGSWRGVYQGPYHIGLNIWTEGNRAVGNWRAVGDREGEFSGTAFGNLLVLNWAEHATSSKERWSGRGYFVYSAAQGGKPAQIYGEWGMGRSGRTNPWWAVKRGDEPLGNRAAPLIDKDADEQYRDETPGCEMGNCDTHDAEEQ